MSRLLSNQKTRNAIIQATFVGVIGVIVIAAISVGRANMATQGISVSFDFLQRSTGWDIAFTLIDYEVHDTYARALWVGALNTLLLGAIIIVGATMIGTIMGVARLSANGLLRMIATTYVETIRNIPLLLQALFWYTLCTHLPAAREALSPLPNVFWTNRGLYFPTLNVTGASSAMAAFVVLAVVALLIWSVRARRANLWLQSTRTMFRLVLTGVGGCLIWLILATGRLPDTGLLDLPKLAGLNFRDGLRFPPEFLAAIIATVLFGGAYIAEIVRAGLLSVKRGQTEAGLSIGLTEGQVFRRIRLPLAIRYVLPTLTNQYVWLMKATTVGIVVGFNDFFMIIANSINKSGQTISLIIILIVGFWILNFSLAAILNWINARVAIRGTQNR